MTTKNIAIKAMLALCAASPAAALADDGVRVEQLGVDNTLVRVIGSGNVLMLPVQESVDDARVNVIADGKLMETLNVRLSKSKTDYSVPFDLTPYKGKQVVLEIVTPQGRGSMRNAGEDVCWKDIRLVDSFTFTDSEQKYRPVYHHTPQYGWMNDPNGMFYKDGVWHLYYQYNPYGSKWQNMSWGHSTSKDLMHWDRNHPVALRPDGLGMIFSGSAAIDRDNTAGMGKDAVIALYTSAATSQVQSLAHSTDGGETFTTYPGNPVITLGSEARDPNFFFNEATGEWNLVLAHALDHEMLFFTSPDLKTWTLQSAFGKGLGAQGGVWECPDLFRLPVEGTDTEKWMLVCNINPGGPFGGSGVQYFIGDWDGKRFTVDKDADGNVPLKWLDYGKDNYAFVSWSDAPQNRRTGIGWMSNWEYANEVPTMQYRSSNTLPRELGLFRADDGEIYALNAPVPETLAHRGKSVASGSGALSAKGRKFSIPASCGGVCEITADFNAGSAEKIIFTLSNPEGDTVVMEYDAAKRTMSMDRTKSGVTGFSEHFPAVTIAPTHEKDGKISLRIFLDRSSIELFGNDGRFAMTNLVFPNAPYTSLSVAAKGGKGKLDSLRVYPLK